MSSGLAPFGSLPQLAGLSQDDLTRIFAQLQGQQLGQPGARPAAPADPQTTGAIGQQPPQVAMSEADTRRLEQQSGMVPNGYGGAPQGSPDLARLFDRQPMGAPQSFAPAGQGVPQGAPAPAGPSPVRRFGGLPGLGDEPTAVPLPPQRPDDLSALEPAATGTLARTTAAPGAAPRGGRPPAAGAPPLSSAPTDAALARSGAFDPLSGQPLSGNVAPVAAPGQGAGPMREFLGATGLDRIAGQPAGGGQSSFFDKWKALADTGIGDQLVALGAGFLSGGAGKAFSNLSEVNQRQAVTELARSKLQQQVQGRNDTVALLVRGGHAPETARAMVSAAAAGNSTALNHALGNLVPQNPAAPSGYAQTGTGLRFIPGGPEDPEVKGRLAAAGRDGSFTLSPGQTRYDEDGKPVIGTPPAPRELRPGATLYDPQTLQPVLTAPPAKPDGFDTESKLRGEFSKQLGSFADVHDGYGRIISATKIRQDDPKAVSPAADMGLIFGFMKMLDPSSVVREGEYETARKTAGVPDRVWSAYEKLLNGQILTDGQRQDFLNQATALYGGARKTAEGVAERYRGLAERYGVDPDRSAYLPETPAAPRIGGAQRQGQPGAGQPQAGAAFRFQQLRSGGMSVADAYARMHAEGL